jgi:hypothetical protein
VIRRRLLRSKEAGQPEELGTSYIPAAIAAGSYLEEPAARAPARLDADGQFTATVTVPKDLNGTARVTATAVAPGVQGQAESAFQVP